MPYDKNASKPAPGKEEAKDLRGSVDADCPPPGKCADDFESKVDLPGKTDSGPEPDVFGSEIPPQD
jgi:hypothetical protein